MNRNRIVVLSVTILAVVFLSFGLVALNSIAQPAPVWQDVYLQDSYSDAEAFSRDHTAYQQAFFAFLQAGDFTPEQRDDLLKQYLDRLEQVSAASSVALSDAEGATADQKIAELYQLLNDEKERLESGNGGSRYYVYYYAKKIQWLTEDYSRSNITEAFDFAMDEYFSPGLGNSVDVAEQTEYFALAAEHWQEPAWAPEGFDETLAQYEAWMQEVRTLERQEAYIGYTASGKRFDLNQLQLLFSKAYELQKNEIDVDEPSVAAVQSVTNVQADATGEKALIEQALQQCIQDDFS